MADKKAGTIQKWAYVLRKLINPKRNIQFATSDEGLCVPRRTGLPGYIELNGVMIPGLNEAGQIQKLAAENPPGCTIWDKARIVSNGHSRRFSNCLSLILCGCLLLGLIMFARSSCREWEPVCSALSDSSTQKASLSFPATDWALS
jgi:hypothetical protein